MGLKEFNDREKEELNLDSILILKDEKTVSVEIRLSPNQGLRFNRILFSHTDWVGTSLYGIISNERSLWDINEISWDEVPESVRANPHNKQPYLIKLSGGSLIQVVSAKPIFDHRVVP